MTKKLYRSRENKMVSGVCGGFADNYNVDVSLIRLGVAAVVLFSGFFPGAFVYLICTIVIPLEPVLGTVVCEEDTVVVEPRMDSTEFDDESIDEVIVEAKLDEKTKTTVNLEK